MRKYILSFYDIGCWSFFDLIAIYRYIYDIYDNEQRLILRSSTGRHFEEFDTFLIMSNTW